MLFSKTTRLLIALTISCLLCTGIKAQEASTPVTGTVTNEKGQPIEAASVSVSGSSKGTVTDKNGFFSLTAPTRAVLIITYVGYDTVVRQVAHSNGQIVLHPAGSSLNDVIVIGYGTQKRKEVTSNRAVSPPPNN
jgi:hypothetical protein